MYTLYRKSELWFSLILIIIFSVLQSLSIEGNKQIGVEYSVNAVSTLVLAVFMYWFIRRNDLKDYYGFRRLKIPYKHFLYFVPLLVLISINLWNGVKINLPVEDSICYFVYMLGVGFVEEVLFRGFLFKALAKDNLKMAVIISSLTFGLGHLFNLLNGSGMTLIANLCQVVGAVSVGFLFVMILLRGGSIIPCIAAHAAIDMVSLFANEDGLTTEKRILFGVVRIAIVILYICVMGEKKNESQIGKTNSGEKGWCDCFSK